MGGIEGLAEPVGGSVNLLFLVNPRVNQAGITQFGPYAYRANAAQYFNLLWPVCLGLWWTLRRGEGRRERGEGRRKVASPGPRSRHDVLLVCSVTMAVCPFVTT